MTFLSCKICIFPFWQVGLMLDINFCGQKEARTYISTYNSLMTNTEKSFLRQGKKTLYNIKKENLMPHGFIDCNHSLFDYFCSSIYINWKTLLSRRLPEGDGSLASVSWCHGEPLSGAWEFLETLLTALPVSFSQALPRIELPLWEIKSINSCYCCCCYI